MNVFVVPAYNEAQNLPRLLADLESRPELWEGGRLIVVDDGSQDGTAEIACATLGTAPDRGDPAHDEPGAGTRVRSRLPPGARDRAGVGLGRDTRGGLDE